MPCYSPLKGYRSRVSNLNGKRPIVFTPNLGYADLPIDIPCGQCIGCRLERSRQWAIRCMHEAECHEENSFITLTYNSDNLPVNGSLQVADFQRFIKRLRKRFPDKSIRYFHCGEYGEKFARPHYHACLFGIDFNDTEQYAKDGKLVKSSNILSELWPFGFNVVGEVTFESAAYVARYITKKVTGEAKELHYMVADDETGEIFGERHPEYITMSRRPGIGFPWFEKYRKDIYPSDEVIVREKAVMPPKYYDNLLEIVDKREYNKVKYERENKMKVFQEDNTSKRLRVKEKLKLLKFKNLIRSYENE